MDFTLPKLASATFVFFTFHNDIVLMSDEEASATFAEITPLIKPLQVELEKHEMWSECVDQLAKLEGAENYRDELWDYMNLLVSMCFSVGDRSFGLSFLEEFGKLQQK